MNFSTFTKISSGNLIYFRNETPIENVGTLKFYTDNASGAFLKKEFRWSFDRNYWSSWETLNIGNIAKVNTGNNRYLFFEIKYTMTSPTAGKVTSFAVEYIVNPNETYAPAVEDVTNMDNNHILPDGCNDLGGTTKTFKTIEITDAETLCGKSCDYYLWRPNHQGTQPISSVTGLQNILNNLTSGLNDSITNALNVDGSGSGVFYQKSGKNLIFKKINPGPGSYIIESDGIITIGVDASIIRIDSSLNVIFDQIDSLDASIVRIDSSLVTAFDQISSLDASIVRIDSSLNILSDQVSSLDASIVRIDSSLVTAFDHLVSLDASVDELRSAGPYLKEASIGDGLVWVDGQLDVSVGSVSGESIDGGVWITNITPTSGGNVGDKSYSSDGVVLDYCLTDTSALTVHVLALPGHTNYKPVITINGDPVTISAEGDKPLFSGTYNIQYDFADASITVLHEDGAHWSTIVDADEPAEILSAVFIGGYPGSQTELKAGDTFDVSIMTDVPITGVILENYGAFVANTFVVSGTNVRITGTIANRGTTVQDLGFSIKVVKSTGSTSASYLSENYGSTDGTYLVKLNNLYPSVAWGTITYPGTQLAIKSPESATAVNTASNYDTISYSSPNGQLTITNPTTYESPKTVTYLSGTYNVSTQNLRVTATRAANNASSIANTVISIANSPATLTVTNPAPRLRSGGNDGTAAVNHTITIGSNQRLLSAPDLTKDTGGTWVETEFTWSPNATSFTRSLQVHDDDAKATYDWKAITATNLAGIVTTTWSGATTYTLGGFVVRTVNLDPFAWQGNINVAVSDYTKLSSSGLVSNDDLVWTVKTLTSRSTFNDTSRPQAEVWSASGTLLAQPTTINILDKPATDSASVPSSFTIQEGI